MQTSSKLIRSAAVATMAAALSVGAVSGASAQTNLSPVVGCDAPGNKQVGGALIGALLGAVAGSNLAKNDRGTGTAIGAVVGGATGSYVGCRMQRSDQGQNAYGYGQTYRPAYQQPAYQQPATYSHSGYRLSGDISPARYVRDGGTFAASSKLNLRGAPSTSAHKVGSLRAGERFQALARVRGTDWILVGQDGVGVGYVSGRYAQPVGHQYASYGY
ncbi:SH3 domain-containing protein [Phenylobacterium sp.]|uniref:SH3 domain-containing protein n=1 Tax=Phenylobacterium sp. TaxID=1871053 RepID=UPI002737953D|nr:SH3 domain-containing protein [Phenylobacterium sp.]MDP3870560.1 SH3 domain-containing protein [Phenylobacterium sp.]